MKGKKMKNDMDNTDFDTAQTTTPAQATAYVRLKTEQGRECVRVWVFDGEQEANKRTEFLTSAQRTTGSASCFP